MRWGGVLATPHWAIVVGRLIRGVMEGTGGMIRGGEDEVGISTRRLDTSPRKWAIACEFP